MTAQAVTTTKKPTAFDVELSAYEPQIAAALPAHISVERFKRVIVTALNQNPELWQADRRSLFNSCVRAAQDGLFPDGREAALVIYNTKDKKTGEWRKLVQYLPMIAGIIKRMRNSGDVAAVDSQIVHEHDAFDYRLGDEPHIDHKPTLGDPGKPIAAYAIIKLTNGEVLREVMSTREIEKVRAVSKAKDNGPWVDWWTEMARKSVLRRCAKRAPVSSDLDAMLRREDEADLAAEQPQAVVSLPGRPSRSDFTEPAIEHEAEQQQKPQEFSIIDMLGEVKPYTDSHEAVAALLAILQAAEKGLGLKGIEGVMDSNALVLGQIREVDATGAEAVHGHFSDRSAALAKKAPAKEAAQPSSTKVSSENVSRGDASTAKESGAAQPARERPPSPITATNKPAAWKAWIAWATEEARTIPVDQIPKFFMDNQEFDKMPELYPQAWQEIQAILDGRRG